MSRAPSLPRELVSGPFVGKDAVARGLLTHRQLSGEVWRRLLPGIYVWRDLELRHRDRCVAVGLFLDGRGVLSGRDAAALWGADALVRSAPIEVTVPKDTRLRTPAAIKVVRSPLPPDDTTVRAGVPVTTPGRTAFDVARRLPLFDAVVCVDAMLAARLVTRAGLLATARSRPGWTGLPQLRKVLVLADPRAESPQETRLRLILIAGGLGRPAVQHEVRTTSGLFVARLDLAYPRYRLGIEYDGDHHRGRKEFQRDLRRLNRLRTCGWTLLRFASADLWAPRRVVATVRAAVAAGGDSPMTGGD